MSKHHLEENDTKKQDQNKTGGFALHYRMLHSIVYGMNAQKVFEFGCGHSSQVILSALEQTGGTLITTEKRNIEDTGNSQDMIDSHQGRWQYIQKLSQDAIKQDIKGEVFEVVLHDGAHEAFTVMRDIRAIVRHIKQNGILLVHDTNHSAFPYLKLAIRLGLFPYRYEMVTIPYGYGLSIIRIKSNFGNGKVEFSKEKNIALGAETKDW